MPLVCHQCITYLSYAFLPCTTCGPPLYPPYVTRVPPLRHQCSTGLQPIVHQCITYRPCMHHPCPPTYKRCATCELPDAQHGHHLCYLCVPPMPVLGITCAPPGQHLRATYLPPFMSPGHQLSTSYLPPVHHLSTDPRSTCGHLRPTSVLPKSFLCFPCRTCVILQPADAVPML